MEIEMEDPRTLETLLAARIVRFNATVQGIVTGLVVGLLIFCATIWLVVKGGPVIGPHLGLLAQFFPGYRVTLTGSVIGFAWGFGLGFVLGFFVTTLYNWISDLRQRHSSRRP